jgi:hypothetical protein
MWPVAVDSLMELRRPVVALPSATSVTVERSTMPRGLDEGPTSLLAKRKRKPCSSQTQRLSMQKYGGIGQVCGWDGGCGRREGGMGFAGRVPGRYVDVG